MKLFKVTITTQDNEFIEVFLGEQGVINYIYENYSLPDDFDLLPSDIFNRSEITLKDVSFYINEFSKREYELINIYTEILSLKK